MDDIEWPPKSPYDALMSSPNGRKRYIRTQQNSPPYSKKSSPSKHFRAPTSSTEDEDDEETLQLQLQAIEAKLKLKKLQSKRARILETPGATNSQPGHGSADSSKPSKRLYKEEPGSDIHVPLSPVRKVIKPDEEPKSPGRVLLGIDKGKAGRDVSLKPAPSRLIRRGADSLRQSTTSIANDAGHNASRKANLQQHSVVDRSFNARMAERREVERRALEKRVRSEQQQQQRSAGFGIRQSEIDGYKEAAARTKMTAPRSPRRFEHTFSHEQVMTAVQGQPEARQANYNTSGGQERHIGPKKNGRDLSEEIQAKPSSAKSQRPCNDSVPEDSSLFDPVSATPLSRRLLPHPVLAKTLGNKTVVDITKLLRHVKAPEWSIPESIVSDSDDYVVFGIIGQKSAPLDHRDSHKSIELDAQPVKTSSIEATESWQNNQRKYMILTLVAPDLRWSIDLYLFTTAYSRWRSLKLGTLVAILNPGIMPPPPGRENSNRWSLKVTSSEDTILEIGTSRDLGWCEAIRKSGEPCGQWVDSRRFTFCEWHMSQGIKKTKSHRMEVQGVGFGFIGNDGGKKSRSKRWGSRFGGEGSDSERWEARKKGRTSRQGGRYDSETQSAYFIAPTGYSERSAAALLDAEDMVRNRGDSAEERSRKILAEREREKEIARQLGMGGQGAGAEYMKWRQNVKGQQHKVKSQGGKTDRPNEGATPTPIASKTASDMGLSKRPNAEVHLSPVKRKTSALEQAMTAAVKRKVAATMANTEFGNDARLGIGVNTGVEPEEDRKTPAMKKTRFMTANGIREAGRDSLTAKMIQKAQASEGKSVDSIGNGSESDDLEIV